MKPIRHRQSVRAPNRRAIVPPKMKESVKIRRFKIFQTQYTDPLHMVGRTVQVFKLSGKKSGNHTRQCLKWSMLSNPA